MNRVIFAALLAIPAIAAGIWFSLQGRDAQALPHVGPGLSAPIDCSDPAQCLVQSHVDLLPGADRSNPSCSARAFDDHQGVDFRIRDLPMMMAGVPVRAAADGKVVHVRDGGYDGVWSAKGREGIGDQECGNGVVIAHEDGYQTIYCHLKRGSVQVQEGQEIARGEVLGKVGMSGRAEYPHLHFGVFHEGKRLDPFTNRAIGEGCGDARGSLWREPVPAHWQRAIGPQVSKFGFTERAVTAELIERGLPQPSTKSKSLVFFARAIWLEQGDIQRIQIEGPEGFTPIGVDEKPLERDEAQVMRFVGRNAQEGPFPPGEYRGRYQVERGGDIVLDISRSIVLE